MVHRCGSHARRRILVRILLIGCCLATIGPLSGCGTAIGMVNDEVYPSSKVYVGVQQDLLILSNRADEEGYLGAFAPLALIDLPLSLVMDTLLLPYTLFFRESGKR